MSLTADLRAETANHAIEAVDHDDEPGDSIAVTVDGRVVGRDFAPEAAVRGAEAAHQLAMSSALITPSPDSASLVLAY